MSVFRLTARVVRRLFGSRVVFNLPVFARLSFIFLAILGLTISVITYLVLNNLTSVAPNRQLVWSLLSLNSFIVAVLVILLVLQALRLRRRLQFAGANMHSRMVTLFSAIAAVPALLAAVFTIVTMERGTDYWFSQRTKTIIANTSAVADAYVVDQRQHLRHDINMMIRDLSAARPLMVSSPEKFTQFLAAQAGIRKIPQALIVNREGQVLMASRPQDARLASPPRQQVFADAVERTVILPTIENGQIMGLRKLSGDSPYYLFATRILSANVMQHLVQSAMAVRDYSAMEKRRFETQLAFAMVYLVLTLVILLSAIWLGLALADRLVLPIGRLIFASRRLGEGDLEARVDVKGRNANDEINELANSFNEMAEQLGAQQSSLDERARFTETMLHGVSSGVVGIDGDGFISHANDKAAALYETTVEHLIGRALSLQMPVFASLANRARTQGGVVTDQLKWHDGKLKGHTFQASAAAMTGAIGEVVITFDDVTNLLTAQRNAAWSDIARRIAHEIKNPLTPIQLSAERLQAKYGEQIAVDEDVFQKCTETIIRQVEDIGRMVDEFASFARMPSAVMGAFNVHDAVAQAVLLQRVSHQDVDYQVSCDTDITMHGDRRLISQALTNVLKNAAEAVMGVSGERRIELAVSASEEGLSVRVSDSGNGWPAGDRYALLEPYHTSRADGTGLGLSIVKKIVEDHGGSLTLVDAPWCASGGTGASVQMVFPLPKIETVGQSKLLEAL